MIKTLRAFTGGLLLLAVPIAAAAPHKPVALVYRASGEAQRIAPGPPEPLHPLDRLPVGITLELKPGARVSLAFVTGKRYELSGPARATLGPGDLTAKLGGVKALAPVPPFQLAPIAKSDKAGPTAGAVLIRGEGIPGLYPRQGAVALAEETVLCFKPVPGAEEYRIEVQDGRGRTVFQTDAGSSPVRVPAGTLHGGQRYRWTVRTLDRLGPVAQGEAELVTLEASAARAREEARERLAPEGPGSLPLLAEIDRNLGLWLEARDELRAALDEETGDSGLREALAAIETRLEEGDGR